MIARLSEIKDSEMTEMVGTFNEIVVSRFVATDAEDSYGPPGLGGWMECIVAVQALPGSS
jgi:hypothetical protein